MRPLPRLRGRGRSARPRLMVFLSHTSELRRHPTTEHSYVRAAERAVTRAQHVATDMAYFSARDTSPAEYCTGTVAAADVYVGIIGHEYGSAVREDPDRSYTELEFDTATAHGLPRLIFFVGPDPGGEDRQQRFRRRLREAAAVTTADVASPDQLELRLYQSLIDLRPPEPRQPADDAWWSWVRVLAGALLGGAIAASVIVRTPPAPSNLAAMGLATAIGAAGAFSGLLASAGSGSLLRTLSRRRMADDPVDDALEQRRSRFHLRRLVRQYWVQGELERSLARVARIELGLAERPGAVDNPLDVVVRQAGEPDRPLPRGSPIGAVFHELHDQVLILGAPGAGKTTTLLELARELLDETESPATGPTPVVFHLSSWTPDAGTLDGWLAAELQRRYDIPPALGRRWLAQHQITPLLDGLDEVAPEHREACVATLNRFRLLHAARPLAVCSRTREYEELGSRLGLRGALVVQPLTRDEVDRYLAEAGEELAGVRAAVRDDEQLAELLTTPLFLGIVALTYRERPPDHLRASASRALRRQRLLADYVASMLGRPQARTAPEYDEADVLRGLGWLASAMRQRAESVLSLDWMQPDWLAGRWRRRLVTASVPLLVGTVAGAAIGVNYALASRLVDGPGASALVRLEIGLATGLFAMAACAWATHDRTITPTGRYRWSWVALRSRLPWWLASGVIAGVTFGVLIGSVSFPVYMVVTRRTSPDPLTSLLQGLLLGPLLGVGYGLLMGIATGATFGVLSGLDSGLDPRPATPGRDIRTSMRNGLVIGAAGGVLFGAVFWVVFGLGYGLTAPAVDVLLGALGQRTFYWPHAAIEDVLVAVLAFGLVAGARFGGGAYVRHRVLRLLLVHEGRTPRDLPAFLEHATRLILLRRRGGGHEFVHRMLLDHFADVHGPPR